MYIVVIEAPDLVGISLIEDLNKQLSICHLESFDMSSISNVEKTCMRRG